MKQYCFCLLFALWLWSIPAAAGENGRDYAAIDQIAEKYIGKSVPGACVILSEQGEIRFSKAYGYGDLEKKKAMCCDGMVFEWGSVSKTFIWVSAMQLAEQGKLDLNENIQKYLPPGFLKNLRYPQPVTMLHLMNHTAGFEEELMDLRYFNQNEEVSLAQVLSLHQPKQVFAPGEVSAYSNWGAALAALIVERISGQEYREYVKEHILEPLHMDNTSMGPFWEDVPHLLDQKSSGYSFSGKTFKKEDAMHLRMYPAGAMNGSVEDLLQYARELAKDYNKDSPLFQNPNTKKEMFTETHRSYGSDTGLSHGFWQYPGHSGILGHEGGTYGFKVQFWVEPEKERAILIITNVMETAFCSEIMEALTSQNPDKREIKKESSVPARLLEGDYLPARSVWSNAGKIQGRMTMLSIKAQKDGGLTLTMPFGSKRLYYAPLGENVFLCRDARPEEKILAFTLQEGKVHSMSFRLAHDYVPAKTIQGAVGTAAGFAIYLLGGLLSGISLILHCISFLPGQRKWKGTSLVTAASGTILCLSGLIGMLHWFSIYSIIGWELNAIAVIGRICAAAGILSGIHHCIQEKRGISWMFLLIFMAQCLAAGYLGFLTSS